jgi:hypothetical protein
VNYCYNEPSSEINPTGAGETCTAYWNADVNGEHVVATSGSSEVQWAEAFCIRSGATQSCGERWVTIAAGGEGVRDATSGALTAGSGRVSSEPSERRRGTPRWSWLAGECPNDFRRIFQAGIDLGASVSQPTVSL